MYYSTQYNMHAYTLKRFYLQYMVLDYLVGSYRYCCICTPCRLILYMYMHVPALLSLRVKRFDFKKLTSSYASTSTGTMVAQGCGHHSSKSSAAGITAVAAHHVNVKRGHRLSLSLTSC